MSRNSQPIIIHAHPVEERLDRQTSTQEPPVRVQVALHFVHHITSKVEIKALPVKKGFDDATEFEPLPQVKLTAQEEDAYHAALYLLEEYFDGGMKESSLEVLERDREAERLKQVRLEGGPVLVMDCPQCGDGPNKYRCLLCRTKGKVAVSMIP